MPNAYVISEFYGISLYTVSRLKPSHSSFNKSLFVRLFVRLFVHSFVHACIKSFIHVRSKLIPSPIRNSDYAVVRWNPNQHWWHCHQATTREVQLENRKDSLITRTVLVMMTQMVIQMARD